MGPIRIFALFPEFLFYIKSFFILNSIFGKIYIFSIKNNFRFQKKFLKCNKKIFRSKISTFLSQNLQTFFSKNRQKSPKKFFQSAFWLKCEKNFGQGSRGSFRNHQFGFGKR